VNEQPKEYMKVQELADLIRVPASTVYGLHREGRIPGAVRFGRQIRFDKAKVESWLEQGGNEAI
jgi:excisionase family DNA binding protein